MPAENTIPHDSEKMAVLVPHKVETWRFQANLFQNNLWIPDYQDIFGMQLNLFVGNMQQNLLQNIFQQNLVPDKHNLFWDATGYCGDDNWLQN